MSKGPREWLARTLNWKLTPELAFRFSQFGTIVVHRQVERMDIRLPFFHLSSDGVWDAFTKEGAASLDPKATQFVQINDEFYALAKAAEFRSMACSILIRTYFEPTERMALASLVRPLGRRLGKHELNLSRKRNYIPKRS